MCISDSKKISTRSRYAEVLVPAEELEAAYLNALRVLQEKTGGNDIGDYLEFGVCHGTSMLCMHRALAARGIVSTRSFGFDSFEGLPDIAATDDEGIWPPGSFDSDYDYTRQLLTNGGVDWGRTFLIQGWFSDTLTDTLKKTHGITHAGVVMVDSDIYSSAVEALAFAEPLIKDAAVLFFDDWHSAGLAEKNLGEKKAFDEFLAAHPDLRAESLPRYGDNAEVFLVTRQQ